MTRDEVAAEIRARLEKFYGSWGPQCPLEQMVDIYADQVFANMQAMTVVIQALTVSPTTIQPTCECGSAKLSLPTHSDWCPCS